MNYKEEVATWYLTLSLMIILLIKQGQCYRRTSGCPVWSRFPCMGEIAAHDMVKRQSRLQLHTSRPLRL